MSNDEDYGELAGARQRRVKVVAWVVIAALLITGGGATAFALLLG
ncbi:hypothetical protein ACFXQA_04570 [Microbacterium sp. P07]